MGWRGFGGTEMLEYREGLRVWFRGGWGTLPAVQGTLEGCGEKNGREVWDVILDSGSHRERWGYADQFSAIAEGESA